MTDSDDDRRFGAALPELLPLLESATLDTPPHGLESRLLERLRAARATPDPGLEVPKPSTRTASAAVPATDPVHPRVSARRRAAAPALLGAGAALLAVFVLLRAAFVPSHAPSLPSQSGSAPGDRAPVRGDAPADPEPRTAAALCANAVVADPALLAIDDFEDGNGRVLARAGRFGVWNYVGWSPPDRVTTSPLVPELLPGDGDEASRSGAADRRYALHGVSREGQHWQAVMANFGPDCYDASAFTGMRFRAKGSGRVSLSISMVGVVARADGGSCTSDCGFAHGKWVELSRRLETYSIRFDELEQPPETPRAARVAFDARQLYALGFVLDARGGEVEMWLDEVEWLR